MLKEHGIDHRYREYTREPLSEAELRDVLDKLGVGPAAVLRKRDANKEGLDGSEPDDALIAAMARNPNLLQRPIFVLGGRAVMGRPVENVFQLVGEPG